MGNGALEGAIKKKTGELVNLSEQNLVDCDKKSSGCNGGLEIWAWDYIIKNGGINLEKDYPYEAKHHHNCNFDENNRVLTMTDYIEYPNDEEALTNHKIVLLRSMTLVHIHKPSLVEGADCLSIRLGDFFFEITEHDTFYLVSHITD